MTTLLPLPRDPRLALRTFFPWWLTERVRWSDTDQVGHVNNISFATYCESARTEFLRELVRRDAEPRALLLLAQINISYLGELHWPGDVEVGTCVLDMGNSSCRLGHGVFRGERCVATADSLLVNIDEATRKPQAIPDPVRALMARYRAA